MTTQPPAAPQEWISREDAAALAGCSTDTIRRFAAKHDLETRDGANAKTLLPLTKLVELGKIDASALTGATATESVDLVRSRTEIDELRAEIGRLTGRTENHHEVLESLKTQIVVLREQLAVKDKQLAATHEQLNNAQQTVNRALAFAAGGAA